MRKKYKREPKDPMGSAHCIIFSKDFNNILIVPDMKSTWNTNHSFPGGKRRIGEGYKVAAIRETKEESGLSASKLTEVMGVRRYFENGHFQSFFIASVYCGKIRTTIYKNETGVPIWVPVHEALVRKDFLHFLHRFALASAISQMKLLERHLEMAFYLHDVLKDVLSEDNIKLKNHISYKPR